jgi:hypothetical protein
MLPEITPVRSRSPQPSAHQRTFTRDPRQDPAQGDALPSPDPFPTAPILLPGDLGNRRPVRARRGKRRLALAA